MRATSACTSCLYMPLNNAAEVRRCGKKKKKNLKHSKWFEGSPINTIKTGERTWVAATT